MPNTDAERRLTKSAMGLMAAEYGDCVNQLPYFVAMFSKAGGPGIDQFIKFLDEVPFNVQLSVGKRNTNALLGCTVNGFTDFLVQNRQYVAIPFTDPAALLA